MNILETLHHTLIDTARLVPFLYLTYLLMEFLEHKAGGAPQKWLKGSGKFGPLFGSALGLLPQCGFSAAVTSCYAGRLVTMGTLLAVYLSTSDEMLPILLAGGAEPALICKVLGVKLVVGILVGFLADLSVKLFWKKHPSEKSEPCIEELCEREHCHCEQHFALSALRHTVHVTLFLLGVTFLLNLVIHGVGEDKLAELIFNRPFTGNVLAALVGIIPNCASSVVLTELYLEGVIPIGAMLSGLLVNSGVAIALLFRNNRPVKNSFLILGILLVTGITVGTVLDVTPLGGWF